MKYILEKLKLLLEKIKNFEYYLLKIRPIIRILSIILFFALLFYLNYISQESTGRSIGIKKQLLIPLIAIINEFSPEIVSFIKKIFNISPEYKFIKTQINNYKSYLYTFFQIEIIQNHYKIDTRLSFINYIEDLTEQIQSKKLSNDLNAVKRRKKILPLIFIILNRDFIEDNGNNCLSLIKLKYKSLSTRKQQLEFLSSYNEIVNKGKKYIDINLYFSQLNEENFEIMKLKFFEIFFQDDYINDLLKKINFNESKIKSFKDSLESVAKSGKFNLNLLKQFLNKKKKYKKLFIVTSQKNLPIRIQEYIRSQPHFILRWASIANIPKIGLTKRYDVFFFSPKSDVISAESLKSIFIKLDKSVLNHPVKLYQIDPSDSQNICYNKSSDFFQSINYFENLYIDMNYMNEIEYYQIIGLLESSKLSIRDILSEVPPAEFSKSVLSLEKEKLNTIINKFIKFDDDTNNVFLIPEKYKKIKSEITKHNFNKDEFLLTQNEVEKFYESKLNKTNIRKRFQNVLIEIRDNIQTLMEFNI